MERQHIIIGATIALLILTLLLFVSFSSSSFGTPLLLALHIIFSAATLILLAYTHKQYSGWTTGISTGWLLFTLGLALEAIAEIIPESLDLLKMAETPLFVYSEVALFVVGGTLIASGFFFIYRELFGGEKRTYAILAVILALCAILFFFVVAPMIAEEHEAGEIPDSLRLLDPLLEVAASGLAVSMVLLVVGKQNALSWVLISAGMLLHMVGEFIYDLPAPDPSHYANPAHLLTFAGYICIAMGAYARLTYTNR